MSFQSTGESSIPEQCRMKRHGSRAAAGKREDFVVGLNENLGAPRVVSGVPLPPRVKGLVGGRVVKVHGIGGGLVRQMEAPGPAQTTRTALVRQGFRWACIPTPLKRPART